MLSAGDASDRRHKHTERRGWRGDAVCTVNEREKAETLQTSDTLDLKTVLAPRGQERRCIITASQKRGATVINIHVHLKQSPRSCEAKTGRICGRDGHLKHSSWRPQSPTLSMCATRRRKTNKETEDRTRRLSRLVHPRTGHPPKAGLTPFSCSHGTLS